LQSFEFSFSSDFTMQNFVIIIKVFRKACSRKVFDFGIKDIRNREAILFEHIQEEYEFVLPLLAIVYILLKLH
jgi:hypothetical protein